MRDQAPNPTPEDRRSRKLFLTASLRLLLLAGVAVAVLIVTANRRDAQTKGQIQQRLAALRTAGMPVSAEDLAKVFPDPGPDEDAAALLRKSFSLLARTGTSGDMPIIGGAELPKGTNRMRDRVSEAVQVYLTANGPALEALPAKWPDGARFASGWSNGFANTPRLPLVEVRRLVQTLCLNACYEAEQGHAQPAADSIVWICRVGRSVACDFLVDHMICRACEGLACTGLEHALNHVAFTEAQLAALRHALTTPPSPDMQSTLMVERSTGVWALECLRDRVNVESVVGKEELEWKARLLRLVGRKPPLYRDGDFLDFLDEMERRAAAFRLPPAARLETLRRLDSEVRPTRQSVARSYIGPNWQKAVRVDAEIAVRLLVAEVALAVEQHRLASGKLPDTLSELAPPYLSSPPTDPFDGQPLRYQRFEHGYLIYSVGADGEDDSGVDKSAAPPPQDRYDLPIRVER